MAAKPELLRQHTDSAALRRYVRDELGQRRVLLWFSRGKDAVASWIALRADGFDVVPVYLEGVPGLRLVDDSLAHFERHFGCKILRLPHPGFVRMLRNNLFAPPGRWEAIEAARVPKLTYEAVEAEACRRVGLPGGWGAVGTRAADSLTRRANITRNGSLNPRRRNFLPVYDWRIDDVVDAIRRKGCGLPPDYLMFGRSLDGIDYRFLKPLRERYPDDYERVLEWFPLARLEFLRRGEPC